ncbi:Alpha/Beta hydrolase protein [Neohortaea acidophila]|uniref:Dipeptidyl-peptidase V n=1 Tax=Neohortaea acidophila TaxID=245834 RepID=A0A6A6PHB5_9PEZI|nr:Alpha/Beta hydrolase protein [Neohortaea acidophila]KAF2479408.1 Alpha/Beta hydrolase protein [Neohortaea acidophila]
MSQTTGASSKGLQQAPFLPELQDITSTPQWQETHDWFQKLHSPAFGQVSNAEELCASPDGSQIAFTATIMTSLEEPASKRIALVNVSSTHGNDMQLITQGPNTDKMPKWSPDGSTLAFLSDRARKGRFRLYMLDMDQPGEACVLPQQESLPGVIEDFEWSADGTMLLFRLAAYGMPLSGFEGSGTVGGGSQTLPTWMPSVKSKHPPTEHRSLWVYLTRSKRARQVSLAGRNIWRACWSGDRYAFALVGDTPLERGYREATLVRIEVESGREEVVRVPDHRMIGELAPLPADPSHIAFVEAVGGSRTKLIGSLILFNIETKERVLLPSKGVDVHSMVWIAEDRLLAVGVRNMDSVALEVNPWTRDVHEIRSDTSSWRYRSPGIASWVSGQGLTVVRNGWKLAPEIGLIGLDGSYRHILSFSHAGAEWLQSQVGDVQTVAWRAADGVDIYGQLHLPIATPTPYKLATYLHGGPFSSLSDHWLGWTPDILWLVAHGYAVFVPNFRGSTGRGVEFAERLNGDIGGVDASDCLSGIDHLVNQGIADPNRLCVMGASYGGYLTAWIITQTHRFAAALSRSGVKDYKLQWLVGEERQPIVGPHIYVDDRNSLVERRSALAYAHHCTTPTLLMVGTLDTCVPPEQARYFHAALLDHGVESVLVEYPLEGHGVRRFPAVIDACCRTLAWFDRFTE